MDMLISFFLMIIISTSLTVPTQPSPRFHVEAWLPFRNREMDYFTGVKDFWTTPSIPCFLKTLTLIANRDKRQCSLF